jgi:mono/diheme cytochrome c family protein
MKKILRLAGKVLLALTLLLIGVLFYAKFFLPNVGVAESITVNATPQRLARGEYLANAVNVCMDCHSTRDWSKFSGPPVPGTLGMGGEIFDQNFGFPGKFYSRNITPGGIGTWTDGEVLRAISCGVSKDGKALFPVMPHPNYGKMDKEDVLSIIAYLRQLPSIKNNLPASEPDFPMNFIINTIPAKAEFSAKPDTADRLAYGRYLFNAAACNECHTKQEKGKKILEMELAGGFEFPIPPFGKVISSNITPDAETGIGKWTEDAFVQRFKTFAPDRYVPQAAKAGQFQTVMPWTMYARMSENDLRALFSYLKTVKPIKHEVTKFIAAQS